MKYLAYYLIFFAFPILGFSQEGGDKCGCNAVLIQDYYHLKFDKFTGLDIVNVRESSSSFEGDVLFDDLDLFVSNDRKTIEEYKLHHTVKESIDDLIIKLPKEAILAWKECIRICNTEEPGVRVTIVSNTAKNVEIEYSFVRPNRSTRLPRVDEAIYREVGTNRTKKFINRRRKVNPEELYTVSVEKNSNSESSIFLKIDGYVKRIEIPPFAYYIDTTLKCSENALIEQHPTHEVVYVYECVCMGDAIPLKPDFGPGERIGPLLPEANDIENKINWGPWANKQCGYSQQQTGWNIPWGTCSTGQGTGLKGCQEVRAIVRITPQP